jgi:hypothetical protein
MQLHRLDDLLGEGTHIHPLGRQAEPARVEMAREEDVVDHAGEPLGLGRDDRNQALDPVLVEHVGPP